MKIVWRGNANAWECDELGHLNVRFYLSKLDEAIGVFCQDIGMQTAYAPGATALLKPKSMTIRFLAEARPGAPLEIRAGVLETGETHVKLALIMTNCAHDSPAASYTIMLEHVSPRLGKPFPWSERIQHRLSDWTVDLPDICKTRSLDDEFVKTFSADEAKAKGMEFVSRGLIQHHETNAHGEMRLEFAFGKISDGVIHYMSAFPEMAEAYRLDGPLTLSSAVLEARLNFHTFPTAGTAFDFHTGLSYADEKIRTLVHWVTDSSTGAPLWSMQAVACTMDLQTRKMTRLSSPTLETIKASVIPVLSA
jgi:acyl-CoA thioester hydrolase